MLTKPNSLCNIFLSPYSSPHIKDYGPNSSQRVWVVYSLYKALLIVLSSVIYTLPLCLIPPQWTLLWKIHATVAAVFIPGSTHPCYNSSLAFDGLPHTNEHLCDHVFIAILLTSALLSPRPGWNRRWGYHCSAQITLCESHHSIVSTLTEQSDIKPRATVASIKWLFRGINRIP